MTETRCLIWCVVSSRAQNKPDKISLHQQEAKSRALAEENDWRIVDVLTVPGQSWRCGDFHDVAGDAVQKNIDVFYRLNQHWKTPDSIIDHAEGQSLHVNLYITEKASEVK